MRWTPLPRESLMARPSAVVAPSAGLLEAIESVDALDPLTVRIRLSRPVPYLPALLALPASFLYTAVILHTVPQPRCAPRFAILPAVSPRRAVTSAQHPPA